MSRPVAFDTLETRIKDSPITSTDDEMSDKTFWTLAAVGVGVVLALLARLYYVTAFGA